MVDALTVVLALMLACVNLGIGTTLTVQDFRTALKTPSAVFIGMLSQFGFMPLMAFSMAKIFNVSDPIAVGLILVGSAPGGGTSNLFTYWSKGNVALSITMTFFSNIAALGLMPLMIYIYIDKGNFTNDDISIDVASIVVGLIVIIVPVFIGLTIRHHNTETKWGSRFIYKWIELVGSGTGAVFLLAAFAYGLSLGTSFFGRPFHIWFIAMVMEPLGAGFGYGFGRITGHTHRDCRTIALETGVQNSALVIGLAAIVWEDDEETRDEVLVIPYLYSVWYVINSAWITYLLKWYAINGPQDKVDGDGDVEDGVDIAPNLDKPSLEDPTGLQPADIKTSSSAAPTPASINGGVPHPEDYTAVAMTSPSSAADMDMQEPIDPPSGGVEFASNPDLHAQAAAPASLPPELSDSDHDEIE